MVLLNVRVEFLNFSTKSTLVFAEILIFPGLRSPAKQKSLQNIPKNEA